MVKLVVVADVVGKFDEFEAARKQADKMIDRLKFEAQSKLEQHGNIEQLIASEGHEFMRLLLQAYFNDSAAAEPKVESVEGVDGIVREHSVAGCVRPLVSLFGKVEVSRVGYGRYGSQKLFPLDGSYNLPVDIYSHGLRRRVAEAAAQVSFDATVESIKRTTGGAVPKRQAEELAAKTAQDFESFYKDKTRTMVAETTDDLLVMSLDGKGIVMRHESLREATKKASEKAQHKKKTRLSPGEKANRKRMATVATVYTVEKNVRRPEEIMKSETDTGLAPKSKFRPKVRNKRIWASVARDANSVTADLFQEALRRDPNQRRQWAMLIDGAEQQLKNIIAQIRKHKAGNTIIVLDFIHVLEYLWQAAHAFYPKGGKEAEDWVAERGLRLLQGKVTGVISGMNRSATKRKLSPEACAVVRKCADYFKKNQFLMRYDKFLEMGLPIATGVIEGACRHLIKDRLDITGARWGLESAEAILKLRSLRSSGDFDEYWEYHKTMEQQRNHLTHYDNFPLAKAA